MKHTTTGTTVPQKIEEHVQTIWHTTELLGNQLAKDGEIVTISRGALKQCCQQIDTRLSLIIETVEARYNAQDDK